MIILWTAKNQSLGRSSKYTTGILLRSLGILRWSEKPDMLEIYEIKTVTSTL